MERKRYSEEQIIRVLEEERAGAKVMDLCRKYGMSDATFYNWEAKYSGMTVSDLRRLKFLEEENRKLKEPTENVFIESFNGRFRDECLNENWFITLQKAREIVEHWRIDYNKNRPHGSLSGLTPDEFARKHEIMVRNSQDTLIQGAL